MEPERGQEIGKQTLPGLKRKNFRQKDSLTSFEGYLTR